MAWHPRRLTAVQLEERRLAAGRLLRTGRLSQAEIARRLGVSPAAVSHWAQWLRDRPRGLAGLRRRPRLGRPPRLTPAQWQEVLQTLAQGARAAGFDTERWTLRRIAQVVRRRFGVAYHPSTLWRRLRAVGWSPQRPAVQARERDDALVEAWLKHDWAKVKRGLVAQGASLPSWTRRVTRFGPV
jgi:putative transposase